MKRIILASKSYRRQKLLEKIGLSFEIIPSNVENHSQNFSSPEEMVKILSLDKARAVASKVNDGIVIGADTIVVFNGKILGKPKNEEDAENMLKRFSNNTHEVITGIAVIDAKNGREMVDCVKTKVTMRRLCDDEIKKYVASGEPLDKAGAYGLQDKAGVFVEKVDGCFYNVVGLPLSRLTEMLRDFGVNVL